jgi:hypothetical protein
MSKYDYIANNITLIKEGVMLGIISTSVLSHFRIYTQYMNYLAIGYSVGKAVFTISENNKISEISIYKIKQSMEAEI